MPYTLYACYHNDCKPAFMSPKSVQYAYTALYAQLQRRRSVEEICYYYGLSILLLTCKGLANMLVFRSRESQLVNLVDNEN